MSKTQTLMTNPSFFRLPYDGLNAEISIQTALTCPEPSKTQQAPKDDCDINIILKRYAQDGIIETTNLPPMYGDFSDAPTYHEAMNTIAQAHETFDALDAHIRARFHNNPAEYLDFLSHPQNQDEAIRLGMATRRPDETLSTDTGEAPTKGKPPVSGGKEGQKAKPSKNPSNSDSDD
jgi:phage internal scaffolding protein